MSLFGFKKKKKVHSFLLFLLYLSHLKNRLLVPQCKGRIVEEFSFCIAYATNDLENREENKQICFAYSFTQLHLPAVT